MKAADRCREHFQGDRCRLAVNHDADHVGAHNTWTETTHAPLVQIMPRMTYRWWMRLTRQQLRVASLPK